MRISEKQKIIDFTKGFIEESKKIAEEFRESEENELAKYFAGSARGASIILEYIEKYL